MYWIAAWTPSTPGDIARLDTTVRQAVQVPKYDEYHNSEVVYFPILFESTPVVVNNAHASDNKPYIAYPWNVKPLQFQPQFTDDSGIQMPIAWVQTITVAAGVPDPALLIQTKSGNYRDGDLVLFPVVYNQALAVIANAWDGANPLIVSAWGNSITGFFISIRYEDGTIPAAPVSVQWIAVGLK